MNFDASLTALTVGLRRIMPDDDIQRGVVLRDATGQLAFFAADPLDEEQKQQLEAAVRAELGIYARPDRVVAGGDDVGVRRVLEERARTVRVGELALRYIDRRVVGADWLLPPAQESAAPPRFVFSSLKGGVGRSTAISVVATENAKRGRNVLVIDLDLEAPGIGSMLLAEDRLPRFGALDYLVERNLRSIPSQELEEYVGTSVLTAGAGVVEVVPVVGHSSSDMPREFLSKLARGLVESTADEGRAKPLPVAEKVLELVTQLEQRRSYDLVLLDARAGLAEIAAGPLLRLGAHILLFATAQRQTIEAMRYLFAHLASLIEEGAPSPWQDLKMVHAKALSESAATWLRDQCFDLFTEFLYEEQEGLEGFNYDPGDPEAPHTPIQIAFETAFADWDPILRPVSPGSTYYERTFRDLLGHIESALPERFR